MKHFFLYIALFIGMRCIAVCAASDCHDGHTATHDLQKRILITFHPHGFGERLDWFKGEPEYVLPTLTLQQVSTRAEELYEQPSYTHVFFSTLHQEEVTALDRSIDEFHKHAAGKYVPQNSCHVNVSFMPKEKLEQECIEKGNGWRLNAAYQAGVAFSAIDKVKALSFFKKWFERSVPQSSDHLVRGSINRDIFERVYSILHTLCPQEQFNDYLLHHAARYGHREVVKKLIEMKMPLNVLDELGSSPMHYAIVGGHDKCVALLLNATVTQETSILHFAKQCFDQTKLCKDGKRKALQAIGRMIKDFLGVTTHVSGIARDGMMSSSQWCIPLEMWLHIRRYVIDESVLLKL